MERKESIRLFERRKIDFFQRSLSLREVLIVTDNIKKRLSETFLHHYNGSPLPPEISILGDGESKVVYRLGPILVKGANMHLALGLPRGYEGEGTIFPPADLDRLGLDYDYLDLACQEQVFARGFQTSSFQLAVVCRNPILKIPSKSVGFFGILMEDLTYGGLRREVKSQRGIFDSPIEEMGSDNLEKLVLEDSAGKIVEVFIDPTGFGGNQEEVKKYLDSRALVVVE